MALYREENISLNKLYQDMFEKKKKQVLKEASLNNAIHADTESIMTDFASTVKNEIDSEGVKEKLRELEKYDKLTGADKAVIKAITKLVDSITKAYEDFDKFKKGLKYDYVLSKKDQPQAADGDAVKEDSTISTEDELKKADEQFSTPPERDEDL